jgi:hypothetical protein
MGSNVSLFFVLDLQPKTNSNKKTTRKEEQAFIISIL